VDAVIVRRYAARWTLEQIGVNSINLNAADVNDDGQVNLVDATILRRHAARWAEYSILPYKPVPIQPAQFAAPFMFSASAGATINVGNASGKIGDIIDIPISIENNPGLIAMLFEIYFNDTALKFVGFEDKNILNGATHPPSTTEGASSPLVFAWVDELAIIDNTNDGDIIILQFEILDGASPDDYDITLILSSGDTFNTGFSPVDFEVENSIITVEPDETEKIITGHTPLTAVTLTINENILTLADIIASGKLPTTVTVTDGTTPATANITDWTGTFDGTTTGAKTLTAVWDAPNGYTKGVTPITITSARTRTRDRTRSRKRRRR